MTDVASLGLEVRSEQVEKGARALDQLTNSAKRAESAASGVSSSTRNAGSAAASLAAETGHAAAGLNRQAAAAQKTSAAMVAANTNTMRMGGSMSGLAAQFQDIGVTAAAGMSPAIIGLQQGAQIAGQMEAAMQGGAAAVSVLGTAFKSLFSPLTFVVIALTTLAAAGIQMVQWGHAGAAALNALADVLVTIAPYAVGAAAALALLYAPAIIGGVASLVAGLWGLVSALGAAALAFIAANPAAAFVLGITAALAAANIFRDELTNILGFDIVAAAKSGVNFVVGAFVGAFSAIKATWSALPAAIGDLVYKAADFTVKGVQSMINAVIDKINSFIGGAYNALSGLAGKIGVDIGTFKGIGHVDLGGVANPYAGAASDAASAAKGAFGAAMDTDYVAKGVESIGHAASAAAGKVKELAGWVAHLDDPKAKKKRGGGGKTDAEKYSDIVDGANRRIASLQAEQTALGLTETEALRLKYTQDLLNQAQQKGITLTAAQRAELAGLANTMATTEVATKKAKEALDFAKDATKGFLSDLRQGLANGEGFWKSFGNAALNVLNKIIDKIETQLVDALFSASSAGSGGGGGGGIFGTILRGIGSIFGFASGGYTGRGAASSVAGVVHGGEYVFSKKATDRIGIGALDQLHQRAKGYAGGGYVTPAPRITPSANQNGQNVHVSVGVSVDKNGNLQAYVKDVAQQEGGKAAQAGISRYDKTLPGRISDVMERHG